MGQAARSGTSGRRRKACGCQRARSRNGEQGRGNACARRSIACASSVSASCALPQAMLGAVQRASVLHTVCTALVRS